MKLATLSMSSAFILFGISTLSQAQEAPTATVTYHLDAAVPLLGTGMLFFLGIVLCLVGAVWLHRNPNSSLGKLAISAVGIGLLTTVVSGGWLVGNAQALITTTTYLMSGNPSPAVITSFPAELANDLDRTAYITKIEVSGCSSLTRTSGTCGVDSDLSSGESCTINSVCASGVTVTVEGVNGDIYVESDCLPGEFSCQAQAVCESITSEACVYQTYNCAGGQTGSWYPTSGQGGNSFNFAFEYDFAFGDYGNICACDLTQMTRYGLAQGHQYCGVGHWTRVPEEF